MNDEMKDIKDIIDIFVESAGNLGASLGISKVVSQIYALLYLSSEPLSLDDICDSLRISKGNVCMNIKYLEQWEAVRKVWVKGTRKDYYEANRDIIRVAKSRVKDGLTRRLSDFDGKLHGIEKLLDAKKRDSDNNNKKIYDIYENRIKEIKNLRDFINKAFTLSEAFLK